MPIHIREYNHQWLLSFAPWVLGVLLLILVARPDTFQDFEGSYYPAAVLAAHGESPYAYALANLYHNAAKQVGGLYVYPPVIALLLAPLTRFTAHAAGLVWYALNLILLAATAWCLAILWFPQRRRCLAAGVLWLFLLALNPIQGVLQLGQADIATLCATAWGVLLATRAAGDRSARWTAWGAGACLATATLFKLYPGGLLLYYVYKRQYRVVLAAVVTGVAWLVLCAGLLGGRADRLRATVG